MRGRSSDAIPRVQRSGGTAGKIFQASVTDRAARTSRSEGVLRKLIEGPRGHWVDLPLKEFELLEILMLNAGRAIPRVTLLRQLWADPFRGDQKTVDVHILRLRRKIEVDRNRPVYIRTLRGYGYIFDREPADP
ncbi:Transcriptional regulatory protein, C terminal [Amycolatopsis xylanica]|uniref:Transcriptional regulatory protein, C terminal n=1 Tax=Amycolatopsis xylanica TaxID=589385 RepID=A0A1H3S3F3_9PSEU|nr:helix-turn-helix domain-containing protein [Amycolatopsis xylanica]SDZ32350.1 Transcriptional regulatory protein, C terminal [Amycolatopsis xylanica]